MRQDSDFGVLPERLGYQLRRVDVLAMEIVSARLAEVGLTPARAAAIVFVGLHPGCEQSTLGRALNINRASAMDVVNALVALGAAERRPGRDRRSNSIHLTPRGEALAEEVQRLTREADEAAFGGLSPEERAALLSLLRKIRTFHDQARPDGEREGRVKLRRIK